MAKPVLQLVTKAKRPGRGIGRWASGSGRRPLPVWRGAFHRSPRFFAPDVRMMIWAGLILGLLLFQALRLMPLTDSAGEKAPIIASPADPYAEARKSRALLEAQEAAPPRLETAGNEAAGGAVRVQGGNIRVIDGDTFDLGAMRIRIADIDTPERDGRCRFEIELAARATARTRLLLQSGTFELHRLRGRDEDRYGRKLRIVTRNGRSIGDQLVAEGLARTWSGRREPWC